jgi:hypothetical protein
MLDGTWPRRYLDSSTFVSFLREICPPDKEDAHAGVVLRSVKMQVFRQVVELAIDHGVSVEEVEKVHQPENGLLLSARSGSILHAWTNHHVQVNLFHEGNLSGVGFGGRAKLVILRNRLQHLVAVVDVLDLPFGFGTHGGSD